MDAQPICLLNAFDGILLSFVIVMSNLNPYIRTLSLMVPMCVSRHHMLIKFASRYKKNINFQGISDRSKPHYKPRTHENKGWIACIGFCHLYTCFHCCITLHFFRILPHLLVWTVQCTDNINQYLFCPHVLICL